jgi:hypothetical protein
VRAASQAVDRLPARRIPVPNMLHLFYASALCGAAAIAAPFVLRLVAPRLARR